MELAPAAQSALAELARVAAPLQADPSTHIGYFGVEAGVIEAEIEELSWSEVSVVARHDGDIVGWLIGDIDTEIGRVWWHGPVVPGNDFETVAAALLASARTRLPRSIVQEEMAIDSRFDRLRVWAESIGFRTDPGSYVLTLNADVGAPALLVRAVEPSDYDVIAQLHDELFPGAHTTGRQLARSHDERHLLLVAESAGAVVGYIAVELQPDNDGYIDYVGVAPSRRRRGVGRELVRGGATELRSLGARRCHLTVREGLDGARGLYTSLGFVEERLLLPLRRGFTIA
jgi:ribosomal protein S18 acetylase RimI-like enzyme